MNKVVKYGRVSSKNQDKVLKEQQKELMQYAEERDYEVAEVGMLSLKTEETKKLKGIFIDEKTDKRAIIDNNNSFLTMLDEARQGKFSQILMEDTSMFVKCGLFNIDKKIFGLNSMEVIKDLREHKVNIHFRKEGLDTININNDFILTFAFSMAEKDIIDRSERAKKRYKNLE